MMTRGRPKANRAFKHIHCNPLAANLEYLNEEKIEKSIHKRPTIPERLAILPGQQSLDKPPQWL
jgi:hypothetical protein